MRLLAVEMPVVKPTVSWAKVAMTLDFKRLDSAAPMATTRSAEPMADERLG